MKIKPSKICALMALVLSATAYGQEKTVVSAAPNYAAPPPPAPGSSAGLVNDWLRQQSSAFTDWDLGAQVRLRYEIKENGGVYPNFDFRRSGVDNDNAYLLLREKVHLGYTPCSWFSVLAEARDSSSFGDERHPSPDADQLDLYQAYVRLGDPATFPLTAKIGRQELVYGDERLVGNADWANVPRSFDAAKLRFENANLWVDAFASHVVVPVQYQGNGPNNDDWFSGIYASTTTLIPKQETQLYFLARNASAEAATAAPGSLYALPSARDIYALGTRVKSLPGQWQGWDYTAELAGQVGSINLTVPGAGKHRLDHEALAASVSAGYTWTEAFGVPRLGLEYNFASGDSNPQDGKNQTFENLFPTNHKLYGYMDFVGWRNIHNPRLSASFKPAKTTLVTLDYHLFWLADTHDFFYPEAGPARNSPLSYGRNPQFNSFLGSELNLEAIYAPKSWLMVRAGYGHFFVGDYIRSSLSKVGGAADADWVYLQTTFNF